MLLVFIKNILGWSQFGPMYVVGLTDGFEEITQIISFGKSSQLRNIV